MYGMVPSRARRWRGPGCSHLGARRRRGQASQVLGGPNTNWNLVPTFEGGKPRKGLEAPLVLCSGLVLQDSYPRRYDWRRPFLG